jgi:hypothetical protein
MLGDMRATRRAFEHTGGGGNNSSGGGGSGGVGSTRARFGPLIVDASTARVPVAAKLDEWHAAVCARFAALVCRLLTQLNDDSMECEYTCDVHLRSLHSAHANVTINMHFYTPQSAASGDA